jgi:hypothetical protein
MLVRHTKEILGNLEKVWIDYDHRTRPETDNISLPQNSATI